MGAAAAARRTQSSFPQLMASTDSSELAVLTGVYNPAIRMENGYDPAVNTTISHLRYVKDVASEVEINLLPLQSDGAPVMASQGGLSKPPVPIAGGVVRLAETALADLGREANAESDQY
jgi:hypothetical protein